MRRLRMAPGPFGSPWNFGRCFRQPRRGGDRRRPRDPRLDQRLKTALLSWRSDFLVARFGRDAGRSPEPEALLWISRGGGGEAEVGRDDRRIGAAYIHRGRHPRHRARWGSACFSGSVGAGHAAAFSAPFASAGTVRRGDELAQYRDKDGRGEGRRGKIAIDCPSGRGPPKRSVQGRARGVGLPSPHSSRHWAADFLALPHFATDE